MCMNFLNMKHKVISPIQRKINTLLIPVFGKLLQFKYILFLICFIIILNSLLFF